MGNTLKLSSPTKLARLGHFPPAIARQGALPPYMSFLCMVAPEILYRQCTVQQEREEGEKKGLLEQTFSYRHLWATENITEESPPRSGNPGYQGKGTAARDFFPVGFFVWLLC
jgi:hypothetical protein